MYAQSCFGFFFLYLRFVRNHGREKNLPLATYTEPEQLSVCSAKAAIPHQHKGDGVTVVACNNRAYEHEMLATYRFSSVAARQLVQQHHHFISSNANNRIMSSRVPLMAILYAL